MTAWEPWLDLIQWPAMAVTIAAAGCVASTSKSRRRTGFWLFLASNVLWIAWGWIAAAWALVVLQVALAALNFRGAQKQAPADEDRPAPRMAPPVRRRRGRAVGTRLATAARRRPHRSMQ